MHLAIFKLDLYKVKLLFHSLPCLLKIQSSYDKLLERIEQTLTLHRSNFNITKCIFGKKNVNNMHMGLI